MSATTSRKQFDTLRPGFFSSWRRRLVAAIAPCKGWIMLQKSDGYVTTGTAVANRMGVGIAELDTPTAGAADGDAATLLRAGFVTEFASSTVSNDAFLDSDYGLPAWCVDNQTIGKKTNDAGANRSIAGVVFGLYRDPDGNHTTPYWLPGPIGWMLGRLGHMANASKMAHVTISDAAASDTIAERAIVRQAWHGTITEVEFTGDAIAADNTDYVTVTISKRDGAGGAAVVMATYDSRAANQGAVTAFTKKAFALSAVAGALDVLETDVVTVIEAKGGAGKVIDGVISVNGKVQ